MNSAEPEFILDPINLDAAIQEIQKALKTGIPWLSRAYGRARVIPEKLNDKTVKLPKVYYGKGEYLNILKNDTVPASSWFQVTGPEEPTEYTSQNPSIPHTCPIALIVWMDFKRMKLDIQDYYHLEVYKNDVFKLLNKYPNVKITRVYDENADDIFSEYTHEVDTDQFLTYPKAGLRFEFDLTYNYICP